MALTPEQTKNLYRAKLTSLVRSHFSDIDLDDPETSIVGNADGAVVKTAHRGVALIEGDDLVKTLGGAVLALRGFSDVTLLVANDAPLVAAIAQRLSNISRVAAVQDTDLVDAVAARLSVPAADIDPDDPFVEMLVEAGASVSVREGVLIGEVLGVEVGRIVDTFDGGRRIDVGVGEYDQNAFAMMHPGSTPTEALAAVIQQVHENRRPDVSPHPLNRLARSRWLRSLVVANPASVELRRLANAPDLVSRPGIRDEVPALALGTDDAGDVVLVVCAVGVSVDAIAMAAYGVATWDVDRVIVVMPERDRYPFVEEAGALLTVPCTFAAAEEPWPT